MGKAGDNHCCETSHLVPLEVVAGLLCSHWSPADFYWIAAYNLLSQGLSLAQDTQTSLHLQYTFWKTWFSWRRWTSTFTAFSSIFWDSRARLVNNNPPRRFRCWRSTAGVGNSFPTGVERSTGNISRRVFFSPYDLMKDSLTVYTVLSARPFDLGYSGLDVVKQIL